VDEYLVFDSEEEGDDTDDAETNEDLTDEEKDIQEVVEKRTFFLLHLRSSFIHRIAMTNELNDVSL
jgi:hypothetical protein